MNSADLHEARKQAMRDAGRGEIIDAHFHCADHREELDKSTLAGCFYCCETFSPADVDLWIDQGKCAMCPRCGIDSVIGNASGFPVGEKAFLEEMNRFWFT